MKKLLALLLLFGIVGCEKDNSQNILSQQDLAQDAINNYPVLQLSHRLGHADPSITLSIYSHLVEGQQLDINNFMTNIGLK